MSISLSEILPPPSNLSDDWAAKDPWFRQHGKTVNTSKLTAVVAVVNEPPPYGRRKGFLPRNDQDFGDGGAFPEIHVAQFPLGMSRSSAGADKKEKSNMLALTLDGKGKVQYDAIVKHGHDKDKVIYSKLSDTKSRVLDENDETLRKPDEEEVQNLTEKTRLALEKLTQSKIEAALPVRHAEKLGPAQYIRYTPSQQGAQFNSGAQQRIIRMVEAQKDPMEPPKFKINQKIPRAPPSPPAPVIHSPTRKVTAKEHQEWKIPPCISNWKNAKGYTIPLDKRLAADGRGLQQVHINENFAKLSEALYIADRKAREAVEMRSTLERKLAQKEKEEKEQKMRMMAQKAREERAGIRREVKGGGGGEVADEEATQRDQIRRDKLDERRRDRNIARAAPEKQAKLRRDKDRDISEQIALGLPDAKVRTDETQFDQRLFNQSKGLDSGSAFDDETYAVYSKPWRTNEGISQSIYRPGKNLDKDIYGDDLDKIINTNKFVPDKGFSGAESSSSSSVRREGPVAFEKSEGDDPFGLGQLLKSAKEGRKRGAGDQGQDSAAADFSSKRKK